MSQLSKETFDREISMCKNLSQKNCGHCNWGECDRCGVIPLLYKLHLEKLLENKNEIKNIKAEIISKKLSPLIFFREALGWVGAIAILLSYFLNTFNLIESASLAYLLLNGFGAAGIIIGSLDNKDFQPIALNIFWLLIALVGLIKIFTI